MLVKNQYRYWDIALMLYKLFLNFGEDYVLVDLYDAYAEVYNTYKTMNSDGKKSVAMLCGLRCLWLKLNGKYGLSYKPSGDLMRSTFTEMINTHTYHLLPDIIKENENLLCKWGVSVGFEDTTITDSDIQLLDNMLHSII